MEYNNQHTKKCLHANFLQMSNSTVVHNKSIWPVLENSYDHKISDWGAIVIKFLSKTHGDIIKIGHLTKGTYSHNCHFFPYLIWI